MSVLPKHTQILIKDLDFQAKYNLSHSQTDLMAYLANIPYWSININGYFVIATSKIMSDLPAMGQKTIEASLKVLKDLELIECTLVKVTQWRGKPMIRGVKLTKKGKEYNSSLVLPSQDKEVIRLKKEKKELQEIIDNMRVEIAEKTPKETLKARLKPSIPSVPSLFNIESFIDKVTSRFGKNSQPICNAVPKWDKETTFYINSYNKLSIVTSDKKAKQLKNPLEIAQFWKWLSTHSERIGEVIDFKKTPTIKALEKHFLNKTVKIGKNQEKISAFVKVKNGVKIKVESRDKKIRFITDSLTHKEKIFEYKTCQEVMFALLV